jgi:hypothetical protein
MRLDRNINSDGRGKYALLKLRALDHANGADLKAVGDAFSVLEKLGILDWGNARTESEFFVLRLKDKYAYRALMAYHYAVTQNDPTDIDYAQDVFDMAKRSGPLNPWCKKPD